MSEWHYHFAGVDVASSLELPEWVSFAAPTPPPTTPVADVTITHDQSSSMGDSMGDCTTSSLTADGTGLSFGLSAVGRYCIHAGREIVLTPCANADAGDVRLFLLGSAWGALSYQRGWFPLHASVVQIADSAVAFCAPSGGGKSSLAAWLVKQGYGLFSDDLCRMDVVPNQVPRVWRSAPRLKLWRDALTALDWQAQRLTRDQLRFDKFHLPSPTSSAQKTAQTQSLPLRALYVLDWGELDIHRLTGLHRVRTVIEAATYRPEFIEALGQTAAYWQRAIDLARQVPIFHLQRPRDWRTMPAVGELLIEHLETVLL